MEFLSQLVKDNLELLSFAYGLVFVFMGAALAGQRAVGRSLQMPVWLLAAFALSHGFGEWLFTWTLVRGDFAPVAFTRIAVIAGSGVLLIEYSRRLALAAIDESRSPSSFGHPLGPGLQVFVGLTAVVFIGVSGFSFASFSQLAWLGLLVPGLLLCTLAFAVAAAKKSRWLRDVGGLHYVILAAVSCGLLSLVTGFAGFDWRVVFGADVAAEASALPVLFGRLLVAALFAVAVVGLMGALRRFDQSNMIQALERANKRNRGILDTAGEGIVELDTTGQVMFANPAATRLLGYETGDFSNTYFRALLDQDDDGPDGGGAGKKLLGAIRNGEPAAGDDQRFVCRDGRSIPVEYTCTPVIQEGRLLGTVVTFSDISHRLRLTRLIKETQRIAQVGGWELDPSSGKLHWTTETYRIHELSPGTRVSVQQAVAHCRKGYREALQTAIERGLSEGREFDLEVELETGEERRVWVRVRGKAYERDGNRYRLSGIYQDITERKKSERALRDSREFYELILDTIPIRIAYANADETIGYLNHAYEKWFDKRRSELVGASISDIVSAEAYREVRPRIKEVLFGENVSFKVDTERDGESRKLEIHYLPHVSRNGDVKGFFSVTQDVTEHDALEEKLVQAQKMEAMGQLTGGVAHDFNNLLGVIMGNLQLLERPLRDDPKLHRKVRTATRAAMRGADLTQRLLAFSRHQRLEPKVVDLNGLIAGLDELVRRSLGENVDVATSFSGKLWPTLIDPGQLENAMVNLAINARDAMEGCGELAISTCNEKVDAEFASRFSGAVAGDYVVVSVADNGSGIPEEYLDRVFQPFFTTKEVGKGSGLGLSMVYGFVEQSGGFVAIDSQVGRGTDIRLYLPRAAEESVEPREETAMHRFMPGGDETVLVVDDEDDVRETVLALMDELGYRTLAAADGAAALAIVASDEPIDLLLTDVMMPGELDGPALAERTREVRPGMKILFTSGFADGKVLKRIDRISASALIAKPYRNEELALRIRQTLDEDGANESQTQSTAGSR